MKTIVFDIGGNGVQYQVDGKIDSFSTVGKDKAFVLEQIAKIINESKAQAIGISSPCGVDTQTGQLHGFSGIKDYENFNLYNELEELIIDKGIKLVAHNDANAALLGNLVGENVNSAAQITIGTGIGGALYHNGQILTNQLAMAGEFGYIPFEGTKNTSEVCSANALVNRINEEHNKEFKNFLEISESGIDKFEESINSWAGDVAKLALQIWFSFAPEKIFFSGGITKNKEIQKVISSSVIKTLEDYKYDFKIDVDFKNIKNAGLLGMESIL